MLENVNLTPIVEAVISLIGVLISVYLIPFLKKKLNNEQLTEVKKWTLIAVQSAEQIFNSKQGEAKKQYVLDFLGTKGYDVTSEDIDNLVESAVYTLKSAVDDV